LKGWFKTQTGKTVKTIQCDGGKEFVNNELKETLTSMGTDIIVSNPFTHVQNGVAESTHQTLTKLARTELLDSKLPQTLWAEAIHYVVHTTNIVQTVRDTNKSPF